jgi:hypothetical protein
MKPLYAMMAVAIFANFAPAQSPAFAFQPVGTTGKLLTSESRDYWAKVSAKLKAADRTSDKVTDALGLPHVHAAPVAAAAKDAVTRVQRAADLEPEPTVLLAPDRRRAGLSAGGGAGR